MPHFAVIDTDDNTLLGYRTFECDAAETAILVAAEAAMPTFAGDATAWMGQSVPLDWLYGRPGPRVTNGKVVYAIYEVPKALTDLDDSPSGAEACRLFGSLRGCFQLIEGGEVSPQYEAAELVEDSVLPKLKDFVAAAYALNDAWSRSTNDTDEVDTEVNAIMSDGYPLRDSFDEVAAGLTLWVSKVEARVTKTVRGE